MSELGWGVVRVDLFISEDVEWKSLSWYFFRILELIFIFVKSIF